MVFRLLEVNFRDCLIKTCITPEKSGEKRDNYYTILIGRNGTGKSQLLADVCHIFNSIDDDEKVWERKPIQLSLHRDDKLNLYFLINDKRVHIELFNKNLYGIEVNGRTLGAKESTYFPRRVIATTVSPFDKFPVGERRSGENLEDEDNRIYRYLGSKNNIGHISTTSRMARVVESLIFASEKNLRALFELSQVFRFLGYLPKISARYTIKFPRGAFNELEKAIKQKTHVSAEDLVKILKQNKRRTSIESEFSKDPKNFVEDLHKALSSILDPLSSEITKGSITIDLDFDKIRFNEGSSESSLDTFRSILFLRKLSLLYLSDLRLVKESTNEKVNLKDASSGEQGLVLTFLGIASEIEDDSLIIIDEPELSLHPEWQERFIELLTSIFSGYKGCHFLLATHSPLILSRLDGGNCAVVTMEDLKITDAEEFSKRSADYQLVKAFNNPGFHNEYLARESLSALRMASQREFNSDEFKSKLDLLRKARRKLEAEDPIAQVIDALIQMQEEVAR